MKKLSSDFLLSLLSIVASFSVIYFIVLPNYYKVPVVSLKIPAPKVYNISPSKNSPAAFNFSYKISKEVPALATDISNFDIPIENFDDKKASAELGTSFGFGKIRDFWNYPVKENAYTKSSSEKSKGALGQAKSDADPNTPGLVNCRENTGVTGYFEAYFEDVALQSGVGYDDPIHGTARRAAVCNVLQEISALIKLNTTTVTPDILFTHDNGGFPPGALAAASAYLGFETTGTDNGSLHKHIISHVDPTPDAGNFDAFVMTKFSGVPWDVDSNLGAGTYSFETVMRHEILHALGFRSLLPAVISTTNDNHNHTIFDSFNFKDNTLTNPFFDSVTGNLLVPTGAPSAWFTSNEEVYRGIKNIVGATPDGVRPVYSPQAWQEGSSLSHFDMTRANGSVYVMNPSLPTNTSRNIHNDEKEVLCHLGYMVSGMAGCSTGTPFAENDFISANSNPICIKPLDNDQGFNGGNISIYNFNQIESAVGDSVSFYSGVDCNGGNLNTALGAKSLSYTSSNSTQNRVMTYSIKDSSNQRISNHATITLVSCEADPGNYICNGGFETGYTPDVSSTQIISCPSPFPFICPLRSSPDVYSREFDFYTPWLFDGISDTHNGEPNNRYLSGYGAGINIVPGQDVSNAEDVYFKTISDLPSGNYHLSFYAVSEFNNSFQSSYMKVYLTNTPPANLLGQGPNASYTPLPTDISLQIPLQHTDLYNVNPNTWHEYSADFSVPANGLNYRYVIFETHYISQVTLGQMGFRYYLDDVNIHAISNGGGGGGNNQSASINGTVFHDLNSDGIKQANESGISGLSVGIFTPGSDTPFLTTTTNSIPNLGEYSFSNLPAGNYNVALVPENIFPLVTVPGINAIIPSYSHAYSASVPEGQAITLNKFGITLEGDMAVLGSSNIVIKKRLADSTLSNTDRNITFAVDVTNGGPDPATNVVVNDVTPDPLIFYSYVSTPPSSYDPATGNFTISNLGVGQTVEINIVMKVPKTACGTIVNTASLFALDQVDTNANDNVGSAVIKPKACLGTIDVIKK